MKKLIIISSAVISLLYAVDTVPNDFTSGEIIKASEMNANFDHLSNLITELRSKIETLTNSSGNRKFVGISTDSVLGNDGLLTVNRTCDADYPGSMICTKEEIYNSVIGTDVSGNALVEPNTCSTFSYAGFTGATMLSFPTGRTYSNGYCNAPHPIACCK